MPIFLVEIQDNITASTLQKTISNWSKGKVYVTAHHNGNGNSELEQTESLLNKLPISFDRINNVTSPTALADTFGSDHIRVKEVMDGTPVYEPPKEPNACSIGGA